jgi:hypothetical protein
VIQGQQQPPAPYASPRSALEDTSAGAGGGHAGDRPGYGGAGATERRLRASLVVGEVDVRLEHPLGSTRCQLLNAPEVARGQRSAAGTRRPGAGGTARQPLFPGLSCGFEVGSHLSSSSSMCPSASLVPAPEAAGGSLAPILSGAGDVAGPGTGAGKVLPIYWLRFGKVGVSSPRDTRRAESDGLDTLVEVQRVLLHSHSQVVEGCGLGRV